MSDLRTRIASWLSAKRPCRNTTLGCSPDKPCPTCRMDADALIRELGLQRASRPNDYGHVDYPAGDRYITDWIADV